MDVQVMTVSSKGQVVLPVDLRYAMSINTGDKLAAYYTDDSIIIKKIAIPTAEEFDLLAAELQKAAANEGYTEDCVEALIVNARKEICDENRH